MHADSGTLQPTTEIMRSWEQLRTASMLMTGAVVIAFCLQALHVRPQGECTCQPPLVVYVQVAPDLCEDEAVEEDGGAQMILTRMGCGVCLAKRLYGGMGLI
ncbi:hypothetical protein FOA52_015352 [Chlamydomonas sp. UWO 241]|nr:hypothetical protein FOA52_015352 [Chlamydomonas sp. UWO 241]